MIPNISAARYNRLLASAKTEISVVINLTGRRRPQMCLSFIESISSGIKVRTDLYRLRHFILLSRYSFDIPPPSHLFALLVDCLTTNVVSRAICVGVVSEEPFMISIRVLAVARPPMLRRRPGGPPRHRPRAGGRCRPRRPRRPRARCRLAACQARDTRWPARACG